MARHKSRPDPAPNSARVTTRPAPRLANSTPWPPRTARLGRRAGKRRRSRPPGAAGRLRKGLHDRGWFPKYVLDKSVGLCRIWHNMIEHLPDKPLFWIGSSLGDLEFCPDEVHIDQPKVSALMRGRSSGFSTDQLFRFEFF